jgi:hypothetical protein
MLTSSSVPAAKSRSSPSFSDANASLSGTNPPVKENPTLIDPKTKSHTQVVKICVPMTGHGMLNPIPYVTSFFTNLLLADPKAQLLSDDPAVASITKPSEIPKDAKINHFVGAPQSVGARKQYAFFLKYRSTKSLSQVKHENPQMMYWLKQKRVWVVPHSHSSMYTTNIGFIHGMHPTFSNRDMLKNTLAPYMETVEVQLVVESDFYYKNNVRFDTMVVKIQVDSDEADYARDLIAKAFFDEDFLADISNGNPKCQLDFIPSIQKQVMGRDAYRAALDSHRKLNANLISISISGVKLTDTPTKVDYLGEPYTFPEMIMTIKDNNGIPYFTSIEPTTKSESEGRFLLLTTKDKLEEAESGIDIFFDYFHQKNYNATMARDGERIKRTSYIEPTRFSRSFAGHNKKYQMDPNDTDTAGVRKNAWMNKRSPQIVYDTDFPAWVGGQPSEKKARKNQTQQQKPKETDTLGTTTSDENTEMQTKISSMQSDFTKRLENIVKQSQATDASTKKLISDAETKQANANRQLLDAFEASQKRTDDAIKAVSDLKIVLVERETRDKAFQKMFLAMYAAMAADNKVPAVSNTVLELFADPDTSEEMDTEHTHGDRSQQTKRNVEGSTKNSGAAASN